MESTRFFLSWLIWVSASCWFDIYVIHIFKKYMISFSVIDLNQILNLAYPRLTYDRKTCTSIIPNDLIWHVTLRIWKKVLPAVFLSRVRGLWRESSWIEWSQQWSHFNRYLTYRHMCIYMYMDSSRGYFIQDGMFSLLTRYHADNWWTYQPPKWIRM